MNGQRFRLIGIAALTCASLAPGFHPGLSSAVSASNGRPGSTSPVAELLTTGLEGASGSTVGPDGALYVTESAVGRISRVDPSTGAVTTFASGLPPAVIGLGGAIDLAFLDGTLYVLVTLVGADVGGSDVVGLYRVEGPNTFEVVADIGAFVLQNPPSTPFDVPTGLQFALDVYRGAFLVTDGHHNRVLRVTPEGEISVFMAFDNIVPTGLAVSGKQVFMAEAGPVPHRPEDGKVVLLQPRSGTASEVAAGASLLVDVEFGHRHGLFALSQGDFPEGGTPATPALPDTGALLQIDWDGTFSVVVAGLNRPTSVEFIGNTAYIVNLAGEIWKIDLRHYK